MSRDRIAKVQRELSKNKIEAFLLSNPYNIFYTTGFKGLAPEDREAFVLITEKSCHLITSKLYNPTFPHTLFFGYDKRLNHYILEIAKKEKIKKIAIENTDLTVVEYQGLQKKLGSVSLVSIKNFMDELRVVKDQDEIAAIKQACKLSDQCLSDISKTIKAGQTESEIAFKIEMWIQEKGYVHAFYPIVAVDKNSAVPHNDSRGSMSQVKKNSLILIDMGVQYQGYHADITRMFTIGKPKAETQKIYEELLLAQEKTAAYIKPNLVGEDVDAYCRRFLKDSNLPTYPHVTGHGLGLEIHENPRITIRSKDVLKAGNVVTVEPGTYFEGKFGMRIEDTMAITKSGTEILTKFPKTLQRI